MSTTLTPPPNPAPVPSTQPPARGSAKVVAILVIVFGSLVAFGTVASAIVSTIASASVHTSVRTIAVDDVSGLDLDVSAGSLRVEFADVDEAELQVTSPTGADRWTLEHRGESLVVASSDRRANWLTWGWFPAGAGEAVLRLPMSLEGMDADVSLSAGDLDIEGAFDTFSLDLSAGRAELALDDVSSATISVSAGGVDAELTGTQPNDVSIDVSAGSVDLTVPKGEYHVTSDVSAGDLDNRMGSTPGASSTIDVQVSAGSVTLRGR